MGLQGKTAIVIGGGAGFGAGIARALADTGVQVMVCDADAEAAAAVATDCGGLWAVADPGQNVDVGAMAYKGADHLGDIDILVNAIAVSPLLQPLDQLTDEQFDRQLLAQTRPMFLSARHFVPAMKARRSGVILSLLGPVRTPGVWCDAARAWAAQATRSMALDLAPYGIRANALSVLTDVAPSLPSFLGGKKNDDRARKLAAIPLGRFPLPDDLAQAAVFLCSDAASLITGMIIDVDGGAGL